MDVKDSEQRACFFMNIAVKCYFGTLSYAKPKGHSFIYHVDAEGRGGLQPFIVVALRWDGTGKSVGQRRLFHVFSGFPIRSPSTYK